MTGFTGLELTNFQHIHRHRPACLGEPAPSLGNTSLPRVGRQGTLPRSSTHSSIRPRTTIRDNYPLLLVLHTPPIWRKKKESEEEVVPRNVSFMYISQGKALYLPTCTKKRTRDLSATLSSPRGEVH